MINIDDIDVDSVIDIDLTKNTKIVKKSTNLFNDLSIDNKNEGLMSTLNLNKSTYDN